MERRLLAMIDDRANGLRSDIMKLGYDRDESVTYIKDCIENDIPKLREAVAIEIKDKDEASNEIVKKINGECNIIQKKIMDNKKNNEKSEEAMLDMLKVMVKNIKGELHFERLERESTQESLITLLENTFSMLAIANAGK